MTAEAHSGSAKPARLDAAEEAYRVLAQMIANGEFPAGSRLREQTLAESIGVSRTPVREALNRLSVEGVVELTPNRGAQLVSFSAADMDDLFDLRSRLEPRAVALAVPRLSAEDLEQILNLSKEMERLAGQRHKISSGELEQLNVLNNSFHGMFFDRCNNRLLTGALRRVIRPSIVALTFHRYTPRALARSMLHHAEIVEAASIGDAEWAESVMRAHILAARHALPAAPEA